MHFNNQNIIRNIKNILQQHGFNLSNTPHMNLFIETLVNAILDEVKSNISTSTSKDK